MWIGQFVVAFSRLEFVMRSLFERMIGLSNKEGDIVFANYDFAALARAMGAFAKTLPEQDNASSKLFAKLIAECLRINTERVKIVHGTWHVERVAQHLSRNTFQVSHSFSNDEDLPKLINATGDAFEEFCTIFDKNEKWGPISRFLKDERWNEAEH